MSEISDAARRYKAAGWNPIPLKKGEKKPLDNGWQKQTVNDEDIDATFPDESNIGIALGPSSGNLLDADLDDPIVVRMAPHFLPKTGRIFGRASKRRSHWLYRALEGEIVRRKTYSDVDGAILLEIRGDGHQTMIPPSVHPGGEPVEWDAEGDAIELPLETLTKAAGWLAGAAMLARGWSEWGSQHHAVCLHLAGGMLRSGLSATLVETFVRTVCLYGGDGEIEDRLKTVRNTAEKLDAGDTNVTGFPSLIEIIGVDRVKRLILWLGLSPSSDGFNDTDDGNANRLISYFGEDLRFVPEWGSWAIWDGTRWRKDEREAIFGYAREIPKKIADEARDTNDEDRRKALFKHGINSQAVQRLNALIRIAKTDQRAVVDSGDIDLDPWLFNVANGTINLRTGGLQTHDRNDLISKLSPITYNPRAPRDLWAGYLDVVTGGRQELADFLQRLAGYTMTGSTVEHVFTFLWGPPGTGKTTFIEILRDVFGDYARNADAKTFMQKNQSGRATPEIARLQGARLVTASETEENQRLAVATVKRLSGSDRMTASFLYANDFEFDPVMKLWLATNHKPRIPADDEALWQRLILVPFTTPIRGTPLEVKGFKDHIRRELPGVLRWCVEGALRWQTEGLGRPPQVDEAISDYRAENDPLGQFIDDRCTVEPDVSQASSALYRSYSDWAKANHERPITNRLFKAKLEERGFTLRKTATVNLWIGIRADTAEGSFADGQASPFGAQVM